MTPQSNRAGPQPPPLPHPVIICVDLRHLRAKVLIQGEKIKVNQAGTRWIKVNQAILKHFFMQKPKESHRLTAT
jgi:hypothetical protein